ncbi:MAG: transcription-repair coupling factor [Thermoguttaceae bacterium]
MAEVQSTSTACGRLLELVERLAAQSDFGEVVRQLQSGHAGTFDGAWGSSCALVAAGLAGKGRGPLVVVCPTPDEADDFLDDFSLFSRLTPHRFPALEVVSGDRVLLDEVFGDRVRVLKRLVGGESPDVVVTSTAALLQPVPSRATMAQQTRSIRVGEPTGVEELARWLTENEFHRTTAVELPGEFAVRGGLLDIFAPDWYDPVRVEFFGDQIDSLRRFEVAGQRSLGQLESVDLTMLSPTVRHEAHLADHLPEGSWFLLIEPEDIQEAGRQYLARLERPQELHSTGAVLEQVLRFPSATASAVAASSLEATCQLRLESVERFSGDIGKVREELNAAGLRQEVVLVCPTAAEVERLSEIFGTTQLAQEGRLHFTLGKLRRGFRLVAESVLLLTSSELFDRTDVRRPVRRRLGKAIDSFVDLREGDLVVHLTHGIGRYRGMKLLEKGEQVEEHLVIEFQESTKLYVPASKIGLVQKYVGGAKSRPRLAKLGGRLWGRQKEVVEKAVVDLAADMIELQAARSARPGIAFPPDSPWQREFDASFPYQETDDQLSAIEAVKDDMTLPRPMDRLLCGDVGFGKTEVAMRAAFKAVEAGYQVGILVPTTVLAEQHYRTFSQRMAEFPVAIAVLSRFASRKEQAQVVEGLACGTIDIVIGTHRLAQADVQFQNLGLVIIDEEQRFGVQVKERLKALRHIVDVLTMTATPIPRTLHMSLLGIRDISNLETPPEDRLAVETRVTRFNPEIVRHAILREISRNGQVFFVHNRVLDIDKVARKLEQIVPEATIGIGHAQMPEHELEQVMSDFVRHEFDVLLSTTIVESGLDIPNANTIFIDEAERYGLSDLHQLRGRVGRYKHRAYCYLLIDPNRHVTPNAARRLRAIEEFSDLGAGFAVAMRDLEIRGAGNILGTQQSGHIALVGYELYCDLLEKAVRQMKNMTPRTMVDVDVDLPCEAFLPGHYVPDMRLKIDLYRRLARVTEVKQLEDFRLELVDRFGPIPAQTEGLLNLAELRIAAHHWGVQSVRIEDRYAVLGYADSRKIRRLAEMSGRRLRVADDRDAYLMLPQEFMSPEEIVASIKSLLQAR